MMSFQRTLRYLFLLTVAAMAVTLVYHYGQATARSHVLNFLRLRQNEERLLTRVMAAPETRETVQFVRGSPVKFLSKESGDQRLKNDENKAKTEPEKPKVVDKPVKVVEAEKPKIVDKPVEKPKVVEKPVEKPKVVEKTAEKPKVVEKTVEKPKVADKSVVEKVAKTELKKTVETPESAKTDTAKKADVKKTTKTVTTTAKPTPKVPSKYVKVEDIIDIDKTYAGQPPFVIWPENVGITMPKFDWKKPVPNILHLAWYGGPAGKRGNRMRFHHYVSFLSAFKRLKPKRILFWHDQLPTGEWWDQITQRTKEVLQFVQRQAPTFIFDRPVAVPEHQSDVVRLEAVMYYGGVYIDLDVIVLNDFQPLYKYNTTMGYEVDYGLCNGIIVSKAAAPFLTLWYDKYHTFDDKKWSDHSVMLPATLAKQNPKLIHTEADTMHKPYWGEMDKIYGKKKYNWRKNYSIHLWFRLYGKEHSIEDVKTMNSTFGAIFRYTIFDSPDLITKR